MNAGESPRTGWYPPPIFFVTNSFILPPPQKKNKNMSQTWKDIFKVVLGIKSKPVVETHYTFQPVMATI